MRESKIEKLIKDYVDFGAGFFFYSKDRLKDFVDQMIERGEISSYEADSLYSKLSNKAKKQREEIERICRESLEDYLKLNEYVKKSDLEFYIKEEIKKQMEKLKEEEN
ncbi:MAG: hypothetical protein PUG67_01730 [Peptoniphilaceae bacterium]|nr:hypothetical protein [Peptoniphilaceae bacterium]MDY6019717.1 hypothetical protein [Anaerococcus sp.]